MSAAPRPEIREVAEVVTLQAISDPLRLDILKTLMRGGELRTMTVKELAGELDSRPTRLYRHVKQLVAAELVEVVETRLVSGIVEHHYRACQRDIQLGPGLLGDGGQGSQVAAAVGAAMDSHRARLISSLAQAGNDNPPLVAVIEARMSAERAQELRSRLKALIAEYDTGEMAYGEVQIDLFVGLEIQDDAPQK